MCPPPTPRNSLSSTLQLTLSNPCPLIHLPFSGQRAAPAHLGFFQNHNHVNGADISVPSTVFLPTAYTMALNPSAVSN